MYTKTIADFSNLALKKATTLRKNPLAFSIGAAMAGIYIGLGIILIFSIASDLPPEYQKLVMGCAFGIALTLVIFAGSELFTGHTMYMTLGWLDGRTNHNDLIKVWIVAWLGNFVGSVCLCLLFLMGGGLESLAGSESLIQKVAKYKMNSTPVELIARGTLCNILVCLALWASARVDSDSAKCIVIFWCLFGFIASGYEHSVANMTLLTIALLGDHNEMVSISGLFFNLFWVTLGNILGGAGFVGLGYWKAHAS